MPAIEQQLAQHGQCLFERGSVIGAYAAALERCGGTVIACCLHFPIAGAWVDLCRA